MAILDSGTREHFSTGAVRDEESGRGRWDLLPLSACASLFGNSLEADFLHSIEAYIREGNTEHLITAMRLFMEIRQWDISTALLEVSIHFSEGAEKYSPRNWEKGILCSRFVSSTVRHFLKWNRGDDDEPHDRAVLWNLLALLHTHRTLPKMRDLPFATPKEEPENAETLL